MSADPGTRGDPHLERHERTRSLIAIAIIVVVLALPGLFLIHLGIGVYQFLNNPFGGNDEPAEIDPSASFSQLTGWQLPDSATVLRNINTHSGFKNDGDYTLVVQMNPKQLQGLIDDGAHTWSDCPVAPDIVNGAWRLPEHGGESYWARKTSASDTDWHRGHVVIVRPETGRVWIYEWKH